MKRKTLLAGGILRDLEFDCVESLREYVLRLEMNCVQFKILDRLDRKDGTVIVRILSQYNSADLIEL